LIRFSRPPAPRRPASIEAAAGIAIGEAVFGTINALFTPRAQGPDDTMIVGLTVALQLLGFVVGILIRTGRSWLICLNVAAVFGFLYLSAFPDPVSILLGVGQLVIVATLTSRRGWFDEMRDWRATPGTPVASVVPEPAEGDDR